MSIEITKIKDTLPGIKHRLVEMTKPTLLLGTFTNRAELLLAEYGAPEINQPASPFLSELLDKHVNLFKDGTLEVIIGQKKASDMLAEYATATIKEPTPVKLEYNIND